VLLRSGVCRFGLPLAVTVFAAVCASATAAQLVSEGVTFSAESGLYTYRYAIDNRNGAHFVVGIGVLVIPNAAFYQLAPLQHTSPPDWDFGTAAFDWTVNPPPGTYQQWTGRVGLSPGSYLSGFSIATSYPPTTRATPNYWLVRFPNELDTGVVPAPELPAPPSIPSLSPAVSIFLCLALASVAVVAISNKSA
jgi:hypothetical protein